MTKIQQMLAAGISVIPEKSNESLDRYEFVSITLEQQKIVADIVNPPTSAILSAQAKKANAKINARNVVSLRSLSPQQARRWLEKKINGEVSPATVDVIGAILDLVIALRDETMSDL